MENQTNIRVTFVIANMICVGGYNFLKITRTISSFVAINRSSLSTGSVLVHDNNNFLWPFGFCLTTEIVELNVVN